MLNKNIVILSILIAGLTGCASVDVMDDPKPGNFFFATVRADRLENGEENRTTKNYSYRYLGRFPEGVLYAKTSIEGSFRGALFVRNEKIVKVLSADEFAQFIEAQRIAAERQRQIIEDERRRVEAERRQKIDAEKQREAERNKLEAERNKLEAEDRAKRELQRDNWRYGTTGVGLFVENVASECLVYSNPGLVIGRWCEVPGPNVVVRASIRNNLSRDIKDVEVRCKHYAQSGTELAGVLAKNRETIYQRWMPGEIRGFSFSVSDVQQRYST
jgi:uncharacterized protein (UPF0254 family)